MTAILPVADLAGQRKGSSTAVPTFTTQPVDGGGVQLFPCSPRHEYAAVLPHGPQVRRKPRVLSHPAPPLGARC